MGHTCGEPTELELTATRGLLYRSFSSSYNAIRTSHNPVSPAFLDACDRLGVVVMDEAFDCWEQGKNRQDYNLYASRAGQLHPQWGSIRFRLAPRTYDAPPCGPSVRVVPDRLTKSRQTPTLNMSPYLVRGQVL